MRTLRGGVVWVVEPTVADVLHGYSLATARTSIQRREGPLLRRPKKRGKRAPGFLFRFRFFGDLGLLRAALLRLE